MLFVDGNGILHPRQMGLATHIGVLLDIPTIGCAKKLMDIDGLNKSHIRAIKKEFKNNY